MSSGGDVEDNSDRAAAIEAEANRLAAQEETWANRPDQHGPMGSTTWDSVRIDPHTGREVVQLEGGGFWYKDEMEAHYAGTNTPEQRKKIFDANAPGGGLKDTVTDWTQTSKFNDQAQDIYDKGVGLMGSQMDYRSNQIDQWSNNPFDTSGIGGSSLEGTISRGDLDQFGQNSANLGAQDWRQFGTTQAQITGDQWKNIGMADPTLGADDWRQFGTSEQTIGADDWRQFGTSEQTIGADDWRQFGTSDPTLNSGSYDERFGDANADPTGGFGAHGMEGGDWNQISYSPEAIRNKAEQQTLDFMNSQMDPQWDTRQSDLEQQLTNQGLQWGDAAWDNAMESMKNSRDKAYAGARNQALADSRSEANMLWGQEMQRSEQKNFQTQADIDNIYRARQANIGNYQQGQSMEQQNYLNYMNSAFDQDFQSRQQQLNANLDYGNSSFQQDYQGRQQQLDANLGYGRESFQQDFQGRQQQLDANLNYGQAAFGQDLASKQQGLDAQLAYGREGFQQDYQSRQQQLDANLNYSNSAFDQDLQARQANVSNYLNYGNAEWQQAYGGQQLDLQARIAAENAARDRYLAVNPGDTANILDGMNDRLTG